MKYLKIDGGIDFAPRYFPNTQEGLEAMHHWWEMNWLIGCRPKITETDNSHP